MVDIEFCVDCTEKEQTENVIRRAAEYIMQREGVRASVCITIVSEDEIRRINREFREIDKVTDVLSFPAWDGGEYDLTDGFLGDIAICEKRAREQAEEYGHSTIREFAFLTVHGMLHLLGYDHMQPDDEKVMFPMQDAILHELGIER